MSENGLRKQNHFCTVPEAVKCVPVQQISHPFFPKYSFQHALESLVDRVCAAQKQEFLYKRDLQGKVVTRPIRLAYPSHGTAIKSLRKTEGQKSKLPHAFWSKKS